jgi:AcrR family transcriptional regulator
MALSRTVDETLARDLLLAIVSYACEAGVSDLSLRPLAAAVGASPRTLLYHFGSKDAIVDAILRAARERQSALVAAWIDEAGERDLRTHLLRGWQTLTAPRNERWLRLYFEGYALGLQHRKRHAAFLDRAIEDWLSALRPLLRRAGISFDRATTLATLILAVFRGAMLDLLASGDRARVERAVRSFIAAIELPPPRA